MNLFKSFLCLLLWAPLMAYAQKNAATDVVASFTVKTPARDISSGENKHASLELDLKTGEVKARVQVDSFYFTDNFSSGKRNTVLTNRFREYYMESNLYPVVTFEGKITNLDRAKYKANGAYPLDISGYLTCHGVKQYITVQAMLIVDGSEKRVESSFVVEPSNYKIRMPDPSPKFKHYFYRTSIRISAKL